MKNLKNLTKVQLIEQLQKQKDIINQNNKDNNNNQNTKSNNQSLFTKFIEIFLLLKSIILKITLIALIIKIFKKYKFIRTIYKILNGLIVGIFGFSVMDIWGFDVFKAWGVWIRATAIYIWFAALFSTIGYTRTTDKMDERWKPMIDRQKNRRQVILKTVEKIDRLNEILQKQSE